MSEGKKRGMDWRGRVDVGGREANKEDGEIGVFGRETETKRTRQTEMGRKISGVFLGFCEACYLTPAGFC